MERISHFLELARGFAHNSLRAWLIASGIVLGITLLARLLKGFAIRRLSRGTRPMYGRFNAAAVKALEATRVWMLFLVAVYLGSEYLRLPMKIEHVVAVVATLAAFFQAGFWLNAIFRFWIESERHRALTADAGAATSLSALGFVGSGILWLVILLLMLENLGVNVTTLVASLGVGGIAIGFALQNILGDLFASLSIILDKPFVIGDFLFVDTYRGTVESIGVKTTRLRSLDGEIVIFSNGDLIKSRVRNYQHMRERRVLFNFGVLYSTPAAQLERIPAIVKEIIGAQANVRFDRAHFSAFGASSLDFEVVYWILASDYTIYMDIQQAINLALVKRFEKEGIGFAFPSRTLYHQGPIRVEVAEGQDPASPPVAANGQPTGP